MSIDPCILAIFLIGLALIGIFGYRMYKNRGKMKKKVPGTDTVNYVKESKKFFGIMISDAGRRLTLDEYKVRGKFLEHPVREELIPKVTHPVTLDVEVDMPAGKYNVYLVSDKGSTAAVREVSQADIDRAQSAPDITAQMPEPLKFVQLVEGRSIWELVSDPLLTKRWIAADTLSNSLGVMGSKLGLIVGIIAGLSIGVIGTAFVFILLRLMHVF